MLVYTNVKLYCGMVHGEILHDIFWLHYGVDVECSGLWYVCVIVRSTCCFYNHNRSVLTVFLLVSQATPFTERGRVWSRCNYRVVAEERNYWLGNKMLTSAKHVVMYLYSMTTDAIYKEHGSDWSHQVSAVGTTRWLQHDQTLSL